MRPYVVVQNIALPVARLLLVLGAVFAGLGSVAAGGAWAAPAAVGFAVAGLILVRLLRRAERQDSGASGPASAVRGWRRSSGASPPRAGWPGSSASRSPGWTILVVGALRSTREAAIYAAASRLAIVGAHALQAVGMAMAPRISALLAHDERERVEDLHRVATWWLMALIWPFYLAVAVFAPWIMGLFGPEFVSGADALAILCLGMLVNLATGNVTTVLLMGGKSSWSLINAGGSLALNLTLNVLLTPTYGITGAAIAWAASLTFVNVAPLVQVGLFLKMKPPWGRGFVLVALASGVLYGALGLVFRGLGTDAAT